MEMMKSCADCINCKNKLPIDWTCDGKIRFSNSKKMKEEGKVHSFKCVAGLWEDEKEGADQTYTPSSFSTAKKMLQTPNFIRYFTYCPERLLNGEEHLNNIEREP